MKLDVDGKRLKAVLNDGDLKRFDLSYDLLDYDNEKTKNMLNRLLDGAERMLDYKIEAGELDIEVFPAPDGGCIIWFTHYGEEPESGKLKSKIIRPDVFEFETSEDMLSVIEKINAGEISCRRSELYELYGRYIIIVWQNTAGQLNGIFSEFGEENKRAGFCAYVREHGKLLASPNAIKTISSVFK